MKNETLDKIEKYLNFLTNAAEIDFINSTDEQWDINLDTFWGNQVNTVYNILIVIAKNHGLNKELDHIWKTTNNYLNIGTNMIKAIRNKRGE